MLKEKRDTIIKVVIQLLSLVFFSESFAASLFAIRMLVRIIAEKADFAYALEAIIILAATIPAAVLMGRYYCGYICSFGAMQDFFSFLAKKIYKAVRKKELKSIVSPKMEKFPGIIKYAVLIALLVCFVLGMEINPEYNPWSAFGRIVSIGQLPEFNAFLTVGGGILILLIILSMFEHRAFCRYFCPMGAIYTIISRFSFGRKEKKCQNQGSCCICKHKCGKRNVNYVSLIITLAIFVLANLALIKFVYNDSCAYDFDSMAKQQKLEDGVYTGVGEGYKGPMEVSVTVEEGLIKDITIDKSKDDKKYKKKVRSKLIPQIIEAQSTDVDAISGATYSSEGLLSAVRNALYPDMISEDSSEKDDSVIIAGGVLPDLDDGVYEGAAEGFRGEIRVSVTVADHKVSDIKVISYYDNEEYLFFAAPVVFGSIQENQSLNVDAISGATYSENGLIKAVADALGIAADDYELQQERPRAEKHKESHHITQKFIESEEQYEDLTEKYKEMLFGPDGLKVN